MPKHSAASSRQQYVPTLALSKSGYGSKQSSLLSAYLRKLPFFEVFFNHNILAAVRQGRRMFFFSSFFISLRFYQSTFEAGRGRFVKSTRSTLQ